MLGFSRVFAICLIISAIIGYGTKSFKTGLEFLLGFIVLIIIWKIMRD